MALGLNIDNFGTLLDPFGGIQDLEDKHHQAYVQRKAWEVMLQNQERNTTLVSREITRRTSDQRSFRKDYGTP